MGGRPLTALNILGIPDDVVPPAITHEILRGGAAKTREAGCAILGGHTIKNPEPIYGLSVTGLVHPRRLLTNAAGRPGDLLVLTKPLGTGIVTTGIKRDLASPRAVRAGLASMSRLNLPGADLAERGWVKAATDITGFGLLGHLGSLCRASHVAATLRAADLPVLPDVEALIAQGSVPGGTRRNLEAASAWTEFDARVPEALRLLAADAQTSGGLLLCVPPRRLGAVLRLLREHRTLAAAVIGSLTRSPHPRIHVTP
jgi:selenide,water dikinase